MNQEKLFQNTEPIIQMQNEKNDQLTHLKQVLHTTENGLVVSVMDLVFNDGQMELFMKVNGKIIELMAKVNLLTLTEMFILVHG